MTVLYSTVGCHLCEEAHAMVTPLLIQEGLQLEVVDIADSDALIERYALRIPVLLSSNGEELAWPFNTAQVKQLLQRK